MDVEYSSYYNVGDTLYALEGMRMVEYDIIKITIKATETSSNNFITEYLTVRRRTPDGNGLRGAVEYEVGDDKFNKFYRKKADIIRELMNEM